MGRFDALTNIEEKTDLLASQQANKLVKKHETKKLREKVDKEIKTPESPAPDPLEKPEKYTTHLEPSLVKKLKLHATERDMKDYQVIKLALLLYFENVKENQ